MSNKLLVQKIIYCKRTPFLLKDFEAVMKLEIKTHLDKNPDLVFHKLDDPIKNADRSSTYNIHFLPKSAFPKQSTK